MQTVVLGGAGFLGSALVSKLVNLGYYTDIVDLVSVYQDIPLIKSHVGSINDMGLLEKVIEGKGTVYHLASSFVPSTAENVSVNKWAEQLESLELICRLCARQGAKLVFSSSGGTVYGEALSESISEDHPLEPISNYGLMKLWQENYIQFLSRRYGLNFILLRISNPYGINQNIRKPQGVIGHLIINSIRNGTVTIFGQGDQVRDFISVEDVAEAFIKAASTKAERTVFNIGSGQGVSINDIVSLIEDIAGYRLNKVYQDERNFDVRRNVLSINRAKEYLGWEPNESWRQGVLRLFDYWQSREEDQ